MSFRLGHTTTAFALAGAGLTAYSRMNDGRHFLHDVVGGATIGISYALGTYFTGQGQGKRFAFLPIVTPEKTGMSFVAQF